MLTGAPRQVIARAIAALKDADHPAVRALKFACAVDSLPRRPAEPHATAPKEKRAAIALLCMCACALAWFGYVWGAHKYATSPEKPEFYQSRFVPALNFACSGRLSHVELDAASQAFMKMEIDALPSCAPVRAAAPQSIWRAFDNQSAYMYAATAAVWRTAGVKWSSLSILAGIFGAVLAVAAFIFFRAFSPSTILAGLLSLTFLHVPIIGEFAPHLRDFSKAPFILLPLGLLAVAVTRRLSRRVTIALFAAAGAATAIGSGFRPDVAVISPIAACAAALLFFKNGGSMAALRVAAVSIACFMAAAVAGGLPQRALAAGHPPVATLTPHFFNLGFAERFFESDLKMLSTGYAAIREYEDGVALAHAHSHYAPDNGDPIPPASAMAGYPPAYDAAAWDYFASIASTLPHDTFIRVFYAFDRLLDLMPNWMGGFGILLLVPLAAAGLGAPREAFFLVLSAGVLILISTLQFAPRHFFYLIAFGYALTLASVTSLLALAIAAAKGRAIPDQRLAIAFYAAGAGLFVLIWPVDLALGEWQDRNLARIEADYAARDWRPLIIRYGDGEIAIAKAPSQDEVVMLKLVLRGNDSPDAPIPDALVSAVNGSQVEATREGLRVTVGRPHGYQLVVGPFASADYRTKNRSGEASVFFDVTSEVDDLHVGLQNADRSRWLGGIRKLSRGNQKILANVAIGEGEEQFFIVFEKSTQAIGNFTVKTIASAADESACFPTEALASAVYRIRGSFDRTMRAEELDAASGNAYYFPGVFNQYALLERLQIKGRHIGCVGGVWWSPAPPGTPRIELMMADGAREGPNRRGRLPDILRNILFPPD